MKLKACIHSAIILFTLLFCSTINANTKKHYLYNIVGLSETVGVRYPSPVTQVDDPDPMLLSEIYERSQKELDPLVLQALSLGAQKAFYRCGAPDENIDFHNIDNYHSYSGFYLAALAIKHDHNIREAEIEDIVSYVSSYISTLSRYLIKRWDLSPEQENLNQPNRNFLLLDDLKQLGLEDSISISRYLLINIGLTAANMTCDPQILIDANFADD